MFDYFWTILFLIMASIGIYLNFQVLRTKRLVLGKIVFEGKLAVIAAIHRIIFCSLIIGSIIFLNINGFHNIGLLLLVLSGMMMIYVALIEGYWVALTKRK